MTSALLVGGCLLSINALSQLQLVNIPDRKADRASGNLRSPVNVAAIKLF